MSRLNEIESRASEWVVRLARLPISTRDRSAFECWLQEDPRHLAAYERMNAAWERMDRLRYLGTQTSFSTGPTLPPAGRTWLRKLLDFCTNAPLNRL